jgi:hypothetical protein
VEERICIVHGCKTKREYKNGGLKLICPMCQESIKALEFSPYYKENKFKRYFEIHNKEALVNKKQVEALIKIIKLQDKKNQLFLDLIYVLSRNIRCDSANSLEDKIREMVINRNKEFKKQIREITKKSS